MFGKGHMMWSKLSTGIVIIAAVFLLTGFLTDELRTNWKYAGVILPEKESGTALAFFDAENIQYLSNGDVRVRIKAVDAAEIEGLVAREKEIAEKATEKMEKTYYPPYVSSNADTSTGIDQYLEIIEWEEAANHADIKPRARLVYEIRCRDKMIQTVSMILYKSDGTATFASDFDRWSPLVPGSAGDTLRKILCK